MKILESHGFSLERSKGSHHLFRHPNGLRVIVPVHSLDMKKGTLLSILKQVGLSKDDLI
ncbi:type II toxin-antitoxin system HicA family toxin [Litoribacter alkaliphilus]|uniref:Type II toxin-antitoxin system HicA family toxin n=1 Tax=Litoribacter ruber TaxID=702568 RepID=A0AAP2CJW3_9BACT|nr:type II toxin-antitoxin system HicA family toxin [Litoribacter alkaliphilus]MBS9523920.1 type II toxin-antitoxin system HicA family toxin [Litoribacter alkaliphilus]